VKLLKKRNTQCSRLIFIAARDWRPNRLVWLPFLTLGWDQGSNLRPYLAFCRHGAMPQAPPKDMTFLCHCMREAGLRRRQAWIIDSRGCLCDTGAIQRLPARRRGCVNRKLVCCPNGFEPASRSASMAFNMLPGREFATREVEKRSSLHVRERHDCSVHSQLTVFV
jgi:hypothetical protein